MSLILPKQFEELNAFTEKWAKGTENDRQKARITSTSEELKAFYDAIMPRMKEILEFLDTYEYGKLPEEHQPLYWLAMSLAEVAPHVELYDCDPGVPFAFEEARFVAEHGSQANV